MKKKSRHFKHADIGDLHVHLGAFVSPDGNGRAIYVQAWERELGQVVPVVEASGPQEARAKA